jgi:hypothetical protein
MLAGSAFASLMKHDAKAGTDRQYITVLVALNCAKWSGS